MVVLNGGTIATSCAQDGVRLWLHWQQDDTRKVAVCAGHQPDDLPSSADTAQQPEYVYSTNGRTGCERLLERQSKGVECGWYVRAHARHGSLN